MAKKPNFGAGPDGPHDYEVGKGRPPKHTRFRPGVSGNPNGRPKKRSTYRDEVTTAMEEKVTIVIEGQRIKVTKKRAAALQLVNQAASGKLDAQKLLIGLAQMADAVPSERPTSNATDEAILKFYLSSRPKPEGEDA